MVKVELDTDILKLMQAEHGGWNDTMASVNQLLVNVCVCDPVLTRV